MMKKAEAKKTEEKKESGFNNISGVWEKTSAAGKTFYSGKVKEAVTIPPGAYISIFEVTKKSENSPDYNVVWSVPSENAPF